MNAYKNLVCALILSAYEDLEKKRTKKNSILIDNAIWFFESGECRLYTSVIDIDTDSVYGKYNEIMREWSRGKVFDCKSDTPVLSTIQEYE